MSSRRTRSGASLGSSEPRKLRRTAVRKQQEAKSSEETTSCHISEIVTSHDVSYNTHVELGSEEPVEEPELHQTKSKQDSPKKVQVACSNIWERLAKNDGEILGSAVVKLAVKETHDSASGKETALLKERAHSSDTGATKKNRKPEILVSLLEGETTYPISHRKDTIGFGSGSSHTCDEGLDSFNKNQEKSLISVGAVSKYSTEENTDTYHVSPSSVCFFHNCEYHRNTNLTDFSNMPDVPGEPFFVSLSNDENKELNMVKTSSGTVRVGCNLRKFVDHSLSYPESCTKSSLFAVTDKSRKVRSLNQVTSESKSGKRSGRYIYSSDIRSHRARFNESKDHAWNHQSKNDPDSRSKVVEHKSTVINHMHLDINGEHVKNTSSRPSWHQKSNLTDCNQSDNFQSSSETAVDKQIPEISLRSEKGFKRGNINVSSHFKSLTPCRSTQYPLMKEILIQQSYLPFSAATSGAKCIVKPPELDCDISDKRTLKTFNTFKQVTKSMTSLSSMHDTDTDLEKKNVVKRSERIRCKSSIGKPCSIALHQSVISTMKPADKTFKTKSKTQNLKRNSKVNFGKESQRKNSKKLCEDVKKTTLIKGSKDFLKGKSTMSQEIMEAIIQSIEETVSGCTGDGKTDVIPDSTAKDSLVSSCTTDYSSHQDTMTSVTNTSRHSVIVDHWPDSTTDHNYDFSIISDNPSHIQASKSAPSKCSVSNNGSKNAPPLFNSKKSSRKARKTSKAISKMKALKVRAARSKIKSLTITTTIEDTPSSVTSIYSAAENATSGEISTADPSTAEASTSGKRYRKKTRKAEEAFGDDDVFCDENWPVKKSKSRSRSVSTSSDSSSSSSQRRPRRSSQVGGQVADPVLEEHAFILWASENRSQLEQQHPESSASEVDTILFSRWCEVTENVKSKFFLRAREAFSDDDRNMLRSSSMTDLEASMFGDFFDDNDPVFTDFIRLPIDRQRDMLRKWLKFFQKTLAKKEYIDFIITFKRACNRDTSSSSGRSKRTRMRCLDPSHYKMLFDMIRLTKPRVLEVYKTKRDKDKATVSDTYSLMLLKLVRNEPLPFIEPGCRSHALTEVLQDLGIPDILETSPNMNVNIPLTCSSAADGNSRDSMIISSDNEYNEESGSAVETTGATFEWRANTDVNKVPVTLEVKVDTSGGDSSFDESDYSVLNSDLALGLLSSLSETMELPVLDQDTLDQVFLAPPRISASFNPQRRAVNLYGRRLDILPQSLVPIVSRPSPCVSPCLQRLLPTDPMSYPKLNIHYSPTTISSCSSLVHHLPLRHTNAFPHKYARRDIRDSSPVWGGWCRKNSPLDMHTNSTSMENVIQSPAHFNGPHSKCFKVHAKIMSPQIKLNLQPLQLPIHSRSHQQNKLHPRVLPVSCGLQQRFPTIIYSPTNPALLDKLGSHHMGTQPLTSSAATSSRMSPQPIGLSTPSPLITSLSPLRNVKYSHSSKSYSPHCQMVPYRPRMQLTAGNSSGHRRTTHTIPISTTHKASSPRGHGNLQQIKVCLSTQTLKIPIAKLREPRKTSYIKGKVKNFNMQSNPIDHCGNMSCTQSCQFNLRANPPTSVLAKVLNFQAINDMEHLTKMSLAEGLSTNTISNSRPVNSTFIGTMRPVTVSTGLRSATQLQLVSVVSSPTNAADIKTVGSTQKTMAVNINKNSHVTQSSCIATTIHSNPDLSNCSFSGVSLANMNALTTENMHMSGVNSCDSAKNVNQCENQVCFGENISENNYMDSLFQDSAEVNDTSGEFRVVGTRTVGPADVVRETSSENTDHITETSIKIPVSSVYPTDFSDITTSSLKYTDVSVKREIPEDVKEFDTKAFFSDAKGNQHFVHERCREEMAPTKTASTISCNRQCVSENLLNRAQNVMGQLLSPQTSPRSFMINSCTDGGNTTHGFENYDISHKHGTATLGQDSTDPRSVPTNCELTNSHDCLSHVFVADTPMVRKDIIGQYKCVVCTSSKNKTCHAMEVCDSHESCGGTVSDLESDYVQASSTLAENCDVKEECVNKPKNTNIADNESNAGSLKCSESLSVNVKSPCILSLSSNSSKENISQTHSFCNLNHEIQQSGMDTADDTSDVTLERNTNAVCLPRLGENLKFCEHEYSAGLSQGMLKCLAPIPTSVSSYCTSAASGLQILAETATSARSLLSSRRFIRPASNTIQASTDSWLPKKQDCEGSSTHDSGPTVKKMTMCAVTVQSETGCILVENPASRDKIVNQPQIMDLPTSSNNTCRAATPPVITTVNVCQGADDPGSFIVSVTQSKCVQLPTRTTVLTCNSSHNNVVVTLNETSEVSSTVID